MPCIECEDGKWKFGRNGDCIYDSEQECKDANEGQLHHEENDRRKRGTKVEKEKLRCDANIYSQLNAKYPHVTDRIYNRPLCITRPKLDAVIEALGTRLDLESPEILAQFRTTNGHEKIFDQIEGVAIIPILGTLVQRGGGMQALSGLMSYQSIGDMFFAAVDDESVKHIVLDIDSPGGEVSGVFDLVDRMVEARGSKPITAFANESAFSAAYAIASAADEIVVTRTAGVGSIGVIALHVDRSEAEAQAGIKVTEIFAGDKKADGSPHKPLSDRAQNDIQEMVNDVFELFVETVSRNRNMTNKQVIDTRAGAFIGKSATKAGLADRIDSFDNRLEVIVSNLNSRSITMSTDKDDKSTTTDTEIDDTVDTTAAKPAQEQVETADVIQLADHQKQLSEAKDESATIAAEITEMCVTMKKPELAADFIKRKLTVQQAKAELFDQLSASSDAIDTTHEDLNAEQSENEKIQANWDGAFAKVTGKR